MAVAILVFMFGTGFASLEAPPPIVTWLRNGNDTNYAFGNVGIGVSSPIEDFEVNGTVRWHNYSLCNLITDDTGDMLCGNFTNITLNIQGVVTLNDVDDIYIYNDSGTVTFNESKLYDTFGTIIGNTSNITAVFDGTKWELTSNIDGCDGCLIIGEEVFDPGGLANGDDIGGGGGADSNTMEIYISNSMKLNTYWNISESEAEEYVFSIIGGGKIFPVGGRIE